MFFPGWWTFFRSCRTNFFPCWTINDGHFFENVGQSHAVLDVFFRCWTNRLKCWTVRPERRKECWTFYSKCWTKRIYTWTFGKKCWTLCLRCWTIRRRRRRKCWTFRSGNPWMLNLLSLYWTINLPWLKRPSQVNSNSSMMVHGHSAGNAGSPYTRLGPGPCSERIIFFKYSILSFLPPPTAHVACSRNCLAGLPAGNGNAQFDRRSPEEEYPCMRG